MFKVGDIVESCGTRGVVKEIREEYAQSGLYSVFVLFDTISTYQHTAWFSSDGKQDKWETTPSLKLIERAKKIEKRTLKGVALVKLSTGVVATTVYGHDKQSPEDYAYFAERGFLPVEFETEYEVEVSE